MVPGRRQSELPVGGDDDIRDEVVVSMKDSFWVAICVFIAGQLPNDDGLV